MTKTLFFDAGPIITLVMSRLAWVLPELKKQYGGRFCITPAVRYELIERPLTIRRYEFEALEVLKMIREGTLEVYEDVPKKKVEELKKLANSTFKIKGKVLDVLQAGEVESVTVALQEEDSAVVMDERTLRLLIENNREMESLLERRFKKKIEVDQQKADHFSEQFKKIKIIRSIELAGIAYKMDLLKNYLPKRNNAKQVLLDAVLWATKYNGSAVTGHEIEELKSVLLI